MIADIPEDLVKFKTSLDGKIDSLSSGVQDLKEKIDTLKTLSSSMSDSVSSSYNGTNKSQISEKIQKVSEIYGDIAESIDNVGQLPSIIDGSQELVTSIKSLEEQKKGLDTLVQTKQRLESISNRSESEDKELEQVSRDYNSNNINYQYCIRKASNLYKKLQTMDSSFSFVATYSPSQTVDYSNLQPIGADFMKLTFSSNGFTFSYYLYVPKYETEVTGLPVHLYLHGAGESGSGVLNCSLPMMLANGYRPNGIIICPQSARSEWKENSAYGSALVNLVKQIVEQYSADPNRISLSGHSAGAIAGYRIIDHYPGFFSAFIPISGRANRAGGDTAVRNWRNFQGTAVWAFHGSNDTQVEADLAEDAVVMVNNAGGNADIVMYQGQGHNIQNLPFANTYSFQGGEPINPLDWAFQQTRENG